LKSQLESFEIKGQWWRPEGAETRKDPQPELVSGSMSIDDGAAFLQSERDKRGGTSYDEACRGPLKFDPESGMKLELLGASEVAFPLANESFTILGETSGGRPCTLLGCFVVNARSQLMGGISEREIRVGSLLLGEHIEDYEHFGFDWLELRVSNLVSFLWAPTPQTKGNTSGLGRTSEHPKFHEVDLGDARVTFEIGERTSNSVHTARWERDAIISIKSSSELTWAQWKEDWIEPISRMVTLATGRPATVETTTSIVTETIPPGPVSPEGTTRNLGREIVEQQRIFDHKKPFEYQQLLFGFASLGQHFDEFLRLWFELNTELEGTGDFLFGSLEPNQTLETQLVTLGSVIESYHRTFLDKVEIPKDQHREIVNEMCATISDPEIRQLYKSRLGHANEMTQRARITEVLERAGEVVQPLGIEGERLAKVVVATRNYFVHLGARTKSVLDLSQTKEAIELLQIAIKVNLLLDLDVPATDVGIGMGEAMSGSFAWQRLHRRGSAWVA